MEKLVTPHVFFTSVSVFFSLKVKVLCILFPHQVQAAVEVPEEEGIQVEAWLPYEDTENQMETVAKHAPVSSKPQYTRTQSGKILVAFCHTVNSYCTPIRNGSIPSGRQSLNRPHSTCQNVVDWADWRWGFCRCVLVCNNYLLCVSQVSVHSNTTKMQSIESDLYFIDCLRAIPFKK